MNKGYKTILAQRTLTSRLKGTPSALDSDQKRFHSRPHCSGPEPSGEREALEMFRVTVRTREFQGPTQEDCASTSDCERLNRTGFSALSAIPC